MSTTPQTLGPGMPVNSTAFVHFALNVVELLQQSDPSGLDQDRFLDAYFKGQPPVNQSIRDAWWEEFKKARDYSNQLFDRGMSPWAMIRARPGPRRGQYFYHIVGQRDGDRVKIEGDPASLDLLDDHTDRRWHTQTRSRQRVRAAEALSLIQRGQAANNQSLIDRGQKLLDEFVILSPGVAAMNFNTGLAMDDLQQLAYSRDPHIKLLNSQIRNALQSGKRFQRDVNQLVHAVLALADIYKQGSKKALP
jgi:hypothetical protein